MGREVGRNFELLQKTRTVVAGVGVAFGFRFLAAGGIGIDAPIHYIVHIPPPGIIGEIPHANEH